MPASVGKLENIGIRPLNNLLLPTSPVNAFKGFKTLVHYQELDSGPV